MNIQPTIKKPPLGERQISFCEPSTTATCKENIPWSYMKDTKNTEAMNKVFLWSNQSEIDTILSLTSKVAWLSSILLLNVFQLNI